MDPSDLHRNPMARTRSFYPKLAEWLCFSYSYAVPVGTRPWTTRRFHHSRDAWLPCGTIQRGLVVARYRNIRWCRQQNQQATVILRNCASVGNQPVQEVQKKTDTAVQVSDAPMQQETEGFVVQPSIAENHAQPKATRKRAAAKKKTTNSERNDLGDGTTTRIPETTSSRQASSSRQSNALRQIQSINPSTKLQIRQVQPVFRQISSYVVISDLHLRQDSLGVVLEALRFAHEQAVQRNAGIVFLGDFWHSRGLLPVQPLNTVIREFQTWTQPVIMLPGNHDQLTHGGEEHALVPVAAALNPDRVIVVSEPEIFLNALWIPFRRNKEAFRQALAQASELAMKHSKSGNSGRLIDAVFCHAEMSGARIADNLYLQSGGDTLDPKELDQILFSSSNTWDTSAANASESLLVYSGHLHRPQQIPGTNVIYVGSPYQVTRSERHQRKELYVLDRGRKWECTARIPIDIGTRHFLIDSSNLEASEELAQLEFILGEIRSGDKILIKAIDCEDQQVLVIRDKLRKSGALVEIQQKSDTLLGSSSGASEKDELAIRITDADVLRPESLFDKYCDIKHVNASVRWRGHWALKRTLAGSLQKQQAQDQANAENFQQQPQQLKPASTERSVNKHVSIRWQEVEFEGFGCFLERHAYPLDQRGLVLICGRVEGAIAADATSSSNGSGKTTLAMAPLWALTGRTDSRPEGSTYRGIGMEMIHDSAKSCFVTVRALISVEGGKPQPLEVTRRINRPSSASSSFKTELFVKLDNQDVTRQDVKMTQEYIDNLFDTALLQRTMFFGQFSNFGGLLQATDKDFKDELSKVFNLDIWDQAKADAKEDTARLQQLLENKTLEYHYQRDNVQKANQMLLSVLDNKAGFENQRRAELEVLKEKMNELLASGANREDELLEELSNLRAMATKAASMTERTELAFSSSSEDITSIRNSLHKAEAQCEKIGVAFENLQNQSKTLVNLTAKAAQWEYEMAQIIEQDQQRIHFVQAKLAALSSKAGNMEMVDNGLRNIESTLTTLSMPIPKLLESNVEMAKYRLELAELQAECDSSQTKALEARAQLDALEIRYSESDFAHVHHQHHAPGQPAQTNVGICDRCLQPINEETYHNARNELKRKLEESRREWELAEAAFRSCAIKRSGVDSRILLARDELISHAKREKSNLLSEKSRMIQDQNTVLQLSRDLNAIESQLRSRKEQLNPQRDSIVSTMSLVLSQCQAILRNDAQPIETECAEIVNLMRSKPNHTHGSQYRVEESLNTLSISQDSVWNRPKSWIGFALNRIQNAYFDVKAEVDALSLELSSREYQAQRKKQEEEGRMERIRGLEDQLLDSRSLKVKLESTQSTYNEMMYRPNPYESQCKDLESHIADGEKRMRLVSRIIQRLAKRKEEMKVLEDAFGSRGVPSFVFESSLKELESKTAKYLDVLSDGKIGLTMKPFSSTKAGKVVETIDKQIWVLSSNGAKVARQFRQLSGGQGKRLNLAMSFAFADMCRSRGGFESTVLVLDEVMQALDEQGIRRVCKLLGSMMREYGTILLVSQVLDESIISAANGGMDAVVRKGDSSYVLEDAHLFMDSIGADPEV